MLHSEFPGLRMNTASRSWSGRRCGVSRFVRNSGESFDRLSFGLRCRSTLAKCRLSSDRGDGGGRNCRREFAASGGMRGVPFVQQNTSKLPERVRQDRHDLPALVLQMLKWLTPSDCTPNNEPASNHWGCEPRQMGVDLCRDPQHLVVSPMTPDDL